MTHAGPPELLPPDPPTERRLAVRVPVEETVWVRAGWRPMRATLLELSLTGARLVLPRPVAEDERLTIWLPSRFEGIAGRPLPRSIRGRVAWAESVEEGRGALHLGFAVERFGFGARRRLELALRRFQARFDRRGSSRKPFERRVIARGAGRPRVLLGRDLSATGILVDSADGLERGDRLELAVHLGPGSTPLVVGASVVRSEEGEAALSFIDLSDSQQRYLEKMVGALGVTPAEMVVSGWHLDADGSASETPTTH